MRQIHKLESGSSYSLCQILSGNFSIVIPDLQRDYCWGLDTYDKNGKQQGELVSGFIESIKSKWEEIPDKNALVPMGLIYGYEWPKGTYQLCDGQQRMTTFYLLAGELYRNQSVDDDTKEILRNILVREDAHEINSSLLYSIRETTLYFLSDLVKNYFLSPASSLPFNTLEDRARTHTVLKDAGRPAWYFLEYDNDPTIQSMLGAIYTIRKFLKESFDDNSTDLSSFAKAIVTQFAFIYYDMGNRLRGEETFVVLNTTGEPLSPTENLKPLLIAGRSGDSTEISSQWEEREDWFWTHRADKELTSDNLSQDFYTWWLLTHGEKDTVKLVKDFANRPNLNTEIISIHSFYKSMVAVIEWLCKSADAQTVLTKLSKWTNDHIDFASETTLLKWFRAAAHREIALPLVLFHEKFGDKDALAVLRRLCKNYYIGQTTYDKNVPDILRPYVRFREIIDLINNHDNSMAVLHDDKWYNDDERRKDFVFKNNIGELIECETDNNLRFDLNVLWRAGVDSIEAAESIRKRLKTLHLLSKGEKNGNIDDSNFNTLSNQYRVLRFIKRWGLPAGKQSYVNWKYWGVWFSKDNYLHNLSNSYSDDSYIELLKVKNLSESLTNMLKDTIRGLHAAENIFSEQSLSTPRGLMNAWLIAKMLVSEENTTGAQLLSTYSDYSLCVNKEQPNENVINIDLPLSIGNVCLHHANKYGIRIVSEHYYSLSTALDTPLYVGNSDVDYSSFKEGHVPEEFIYNTTNHILDLFEKRIMS